LEKGEMPSNSITLFTATELTATIDPPPDCRMIAMACLNKGLDRGFNRARYVPAILRPRSFCP
jgi:hypothetical protein